MKYQTDWPEAKKRLTALWHGERMDRPCISVVASQPIDIATPLADPSNDEASRLDPAYVIPATIRALESTWWGGESVPSCLFMGGWMLSLNGRPHFDRDTIWFETRDVDFEKSSPFRHDVDSIWMQKFRTLLLALCKLAGRDDFLIGSPLMLPANDLISMHMGVENFMLALIDHPQWMAQAIRAGAVDQSRAVRELQDFVRTQGHEFWYGNAGWMNFWAPEPFLAVQSDVSCMLSPELFDRFVVPELDVYGQEHGAVWYHLDGHDARQHLPRLLSLPYIRVVQYTPTPSEPLNGAFHLEMYRRIQAAGKIVHIELPAENVQPLVRELDPALLMLQTQCSNRDEALWLLEQCVKWVSKAKFVNRKLA